MDQTTDVERLFSWLKTQDLRYREFAAQREVADAVASWPALHKAAAASGHATEAAAPVGDAAAKARLAREQMPLPPAAAEAVRTGPAATTMPAGNRLVAALGRRMHGLRQRPDVTEEPAAPPLAAARPSRRDAVRADAAAVEASDAAARERAREAAERLRDRLDAAMAVNPRPVAPQASPPGDDGRTARRSASGRGDNNAFGVAPGRRGDLFGGAYRGGERSEYDAPPAEAARRGSSLQAVFSRLSATQNRTLRDPRARARGLPGRGTLFGRMR